jgi:raffinose/stachyose/melibiose transport system permease protein
MSRGLDIPAPSTLDTATREERLARRGHRLDRVHVLSYAILLGVGLVYLGPMLMLLNTALKTQPGFAKDPIGITATLSVENFAEAWERADFARYMTNSVLYAGVATVLYLVAAVPLAAAISRRYVRGWNLLYILFVMALFLPVALIPQFQLILNLHLYNTQPGYILLFLANPIGIIILVGYIRSIPRELDEAVAIDGCGYLRFLWTIVVPLSKPAIATVAILHAIGIWNELVLPTIYLTSQAYYPMTRGLIVFTGIYGNDWPLLAAAVLILALPMVVLFLFLQRYIIGGFTAGSLRG